LSKEELYNLVVLVDESDQERGIMDKMEAHRKAELHRAFSVFIFNQAGDMLLQQRALSKYHSGGLWTNACCSHPLPGETAAAGAIRRLNEEMGFTTTVQPAFTFLYKAPFDNGLTEHEFDHVFIGEYDGVIHPDPAEVQDFCYRSLEEIESSLQSHPQRFTAWFHLAFPRVAAWKKQAAVCIG